MPKVRFTNTLDGGQELECGSMKLLWEPGNSTMMTVQGYGKYELPSARIIGGRMYGFKGSKDALDFEDVLWPILTPDGQPAAAVSDEDVKRIKDNLFLLDNSILSRKVLARADIRKMEGEKIGVSDQSQSYELKFKDARQQEHHVDWRWKRDGEVSLKLDGKELLSDDFKQMAKRPEINQHLKIFPSNNDFRDIQNNNGIASIQAYQGLMRAIFDSATLEPKGNISPSKITEIAASSNYPAANALREAAARDRKAGGVVAAMAANGSTKHQSALSGASKSSQELEKENAKKVPERKSPESKKDLHR